MWILHNKAVLKSPMKRRITWNVSTREKGKEMEDMETLKTKRFKYLGEWKQPKGE